MERIPFAVVRSLKSKNLEISIVMERDPDGYFVSCPALQGCYTQGETYEEAMRNIEDAIRLPLEDRLETQR
jgi:predicted RNase H-like HicB family nuclease